MIAFDILLLIINTTTTTTITITIVNLVISIMNYEVSGFLHVGVLGLGLGFRALKESQK